MDSKGVTATFTCTAQILLPRESSNGTVLKRSPEQITSTINPGDSRFIDTNDIGGFCTVSLEVF
jgi:hypothetical protein